ncbi:Aste57867_24603 [Aphanomyces stellatus]|uniref:Aste57867_24603 protein n=1 Tax=Aphanomyces stellatus TaxID=120398 RepID=A0A485LSY2_9STRA|nr:hypothetical protein As57867_024525 [Aphanomyces stellatus]VFU01241.1 Aste57867_24603 [Aphanomyces stellatus]
MTTLVPGGCVTAVAATVNPIGPYNVTVAFSYQVPASNSITLTSYVNDITILHMWTPPASTSSNASTDFPVCTVPTYASVAAVQPTPVTPFATRLVLAAAVNGTQTIQETATYTVGCTDTAAQLASNGSFYIQLWSQSTRVKAANGLWAQPNVALTVPQVSFSMTNPTGKPIPGTISTVSTAGFSIQDGGQCPTVAPTTPVPTPATTKSNAKLATIATIAIAAAVATVFGL